MEQEEKVIGYIAGIMRTGFHLRGTSVLSVGKVYTPENAMIITNKRIIFITVPLPGAGKIIANVDISMWQWLLAKKDIENKLKEMIESMPIEEILQSDPKNFFIPYDEIQKIKFGRISRSIKIIKKDGKKLSYSIRDKNDFAKAKSLFKNLLKNQS